MVDSLKDLRPGHIVVGYGQIFKLAKVSSLKREILQRADLPTGHALVESVSVRTVPPGFTGGRLDVEEYDERRIHSTTASLEYNGYLDLDFAFLMIGEGVPIPRPIDCKRHKFVKPDLIAYAVAVHGAMARDEIMRMAAALEGLPWIPTSNTDYFGSTKANSLVGTVLVEAGKQGQRKLYALGPDGRERANRVMVVYGEGPAWSVK